MHLETLCVGCLIPFLVREDFVRAAIADGKLRKTTFYCSDDLAIPGVAIRRSDPPCGCGNTRVIVRTRPSVEHWRRCRKAP